ncbi:hypothetical protein BU23DRAFT_64272 [Bimuria novae-zelandiae CBS 107.79]|uniref:Uncharacterized protein n=1 Tax=Bimuria novae-zelandiae CBS 107.79 TaxID=1447943 RepID=A0A6A5UGM4_9PLEO|nr:hypothetical protein BU23DRAFT_64272 [Bimuria novae-zelandiae CBS 107.79]
MFHTLNIHPNGLKRLLKTAMTRDMSCTELFANVRIEDTRTGLRWAQYVYAKCTATFCFLAGVLLSLASPLVIVMNVVVYEYNLRLYPHSKGSDAVDAWGPWVGAAFVLGASMILRYQKEWERMVLRLGEKALHHVGLLGKSTTENCGSISDVRITSKRSMIEEWRIPMGCSTRRSWNALAFTYTELSCWIASPLPHSHMCTCSRCILDRAQFRRLRTPNDQERREEYDHRPWLKR